MSKNLKSNVFILSLFILYILLLVWIILFKLQFPISKLDHIRSINLIPFHYDNEISIKFHLKEVLENVFIFVPMGIYLCMITHKHKSLQKAAIIFGTSLALVHRILNKYYIKVHNIKLLFHPFYISNGKQQVPC